MNLELDLDPACTDALDRGVYGNVREAALAVENRQPGPVPRQLGAVKTSANGEREVKESPRPCGRRDDDDLRQLRRREGGVADELEPADFEVAAVACDILGGYGSRGDDEYQSKSERGKAPREHVTHQPLGERSHGPAGPLFGSGGSGSRASASGETNGVRWIKSCTR